MCHHNAMSSSSSASSAGAPAPAPAAAAAAAANEMAVVSSEQQGAAGGALPHGMTQIMAMIPRAPAFGVDDPSWTKALTTCYNANNMTMALMAANTQQLIQQVFFIFFHDIVCSFCGGWAHVFFRAVAGGDWGRSPTEEDRGEAEHRDP